MKLQITSEDIASEIECELEGRLEVMRDDDLEDSPDYEDASTVFEVLRSITEIPTTLEFSDAEMQQFAITLENLLDHEVVANADRTEKVIEALQATRDQLMAMGYPWPKVSTHVFDYFRAKMGAQLSDETFRELPVDSPCGADCVKAIDAAKAFLDAAILPAYGTKYGEERIAQVVELTSEAISVFWHG